MPGGKTKHAKEQKLQGENIEAGNKGELLTKEIARDEWTAFFDTFSYRHQGWLVTIEVFGSDIGAQVEGNPYSGFESLVPQRHHRIHP